MELCAYGCGKAFLYTFKNGKKCCCNDRRKCTAEIQKIKQKQHTVDAATGLTPLQRRERTLRSTIDPDTGLTSFEKRTKKMQKTQITPKENGLTPRQEAEAKMSAIDPSTGYSIKQMSSFKSHLKMKTKIDDETGLTIEKLRIVKVREKWKEKSKNELDQIQKKRQETLGKKTNIRRKASKQSLKIFKPLANRLQNFNLKIFFGHETGSEWFIQDLEKRIFFYDFTIPDLKLIIEFHGENFHPNKEKLSENEWAAWRMPFRNYTADQAYASDREKEALAKSKGFDYVIVWNDGNIQETVERLHDIILKKIRLRANEEIEQF